MEKKTDRRRCVRVKLNGQPCEKPPIKGATVCASHGGSAPQVKAKAALRVAEEEVRKSLAELDVEPVGDPFAELSKLAGQAVSWKDQLAAKVNELTEIRYEASGAGTEQLRAEIALFERAMDRCAHILVAIGKLGIDERMVRITERQIETLGQAINGALDDAGVNGEQAVAVRTALAARLQAVA